jgi:hypothetical protein
MIDSYNLSFLFAINGKIKEFVTSVLLLIIVKISVLFNFVLIVKLQYGKTLFNVIWIYLNFVGQLLITVCRLAKAGYFSTTLFAENCTTIIRKNWHAENETPAFANVLLADALLFSLGVVGSSLHLFICCHSLLMH